MSIGVDGQGLMMLAFRENLVFPRSQCSVSAEALCLLQHKTGHDLELPSFD